MLRQASAAATPFTGAPLRCQTTLPSRARAATVPQFAVIDYGNAPHHNWSRGGGLASRATRTAAAAAKPTAAILSPLYAHARLRASPSVPCIPRPTRVPALPSPSYHVLHELMRVVCDAEGARCVARTSYRGAPRFALVGGLATTATLFLQSGAQVSERRTSFPEPNRPSPNRAAAGDFPPHSCRRLPKTDSPESASRAVGASQSHWANKPPSRRLADSGTISGCAPGRLFRTTIGWGPVASGVPRASTGGTHSPPPHASLSQSLLPRPYLTPHPSPPPAPGPQMLVSKPGLGLPLDLQFKVLAGMLLLLFLGCAAGASYKRAAVAFGWECACCAGWSSDSRITRWPAASLPHADGHYLQNQAADHPVVAPGRSDASSGLRG